MYVFMVEFNGLSYCDDDINHILEYIKTDLEEEMENAKEFGTQDHVYKVSVVEIVEIKYRNLPDFDGF